MNQLFFGSLLSIPVPTAPIVDNAFIALIATLGIMVGGNEGS